MIQGTKTQIAQKLLQEVLGLQHIHDETELRIQINKKLDSLSKVEMVALQIKLGTKQKEIEAGEGFQKRKPRNYLITMLLMFGLSFTAFLLLFSLNLFILWKIILWPFAIIWAVVGLRTLYLLIKGKY